MTNFFVGQLVRVKAKNNPCCSCPIGAEGRITDSEIDPWFVDYWVVATDVKSYLCAKKDAPDLLEPILPEGHQACDDDFKRDLDRLLERQGIAA